MAAILVLRTICLINRKFTVGKVLEWANLKLASGGRDIGGVSTRAMLKALVAGVEDPEALTELARGRMRSKQTELIASLSGRVRETHRFLL
jgi:hypothetical protein